MSLPALTPFPAIVIGGGISGLACAFRLQRAGIAVRLLEASRRSGGVISTVEQDGFRFELGPQSFLLTKPLLQLIDGLGLKEQLLVGDPRAPRYILLHGKLIPAPLAPPSLLTTPLLGASTKWRMFAEILRRTQPPAGDESVAAFVRRKFGSDLLDRLVAPFVSGVYAGDPEKLSLRAAFPKLHEFEEKYGSVLRGAMKSRPAGGAPRPGLCTFRDGVETLPRALAAQLGDAVLAETRVVGLRPSRTNGKSWFEVDIMRHAHREILAAGAVILAAPPDAAAEILQHISGTMAEQLARIEYAPVTVVAAGYRRDQVRRATRGFGFLAPRGEGLRVLGTVWNSSLFVGRAPEGMACFTSFAGGATDPAFCNLSEEEAAGIVCGEVARVLDIAGPPVTRIVRRYSHALPQYNLGHLHTVGALRELTSRVPGLFLAGNYLSGPSIGACVEEASRVADAVRVYLTVTGVAGVGDVAHA